MKISVAEVCTVTRTTQNEALPWKIADLGIEEAHLFSAGIFCPLPVLVFDIPPGRKCLPASGAGHSAVLMQEDSVKTSK